MRQSESAERFRRVRDLFEAALEHSGEEERKRFVESACADDPSVRADVERLLHHYCQIAATIDAPLPRFGPYQATRVIGRGGMGLVYEAHRADGEFERRVAIKVVAAGTLASGARRDLRDERQILANLIHPNIAQLFDGGVTPEGDPYLVVEFIDGEHLDRHCDRHQLSPAARLKLLAPILDAVEFIHRQGVIHQDLKPSNILVTSTGQPKLLDFGTSKLLHAGADLSPSRHTPQFASPEVIAGSPVDARADIYSLGVIYSKLLGPAAEPSVIAKATEANPADRYGSVADLRKSLFPDKTHKWVAAGAVAAMLTAGALWFWWARPDAPSLIAISPQQGSWREAALSWSGEWMAFSDGETPSRRDIWVSRGDGSSAERLFADPFLDQDPTISSDGRFVAFRSNRVPEGVYEFDRSTRSIRSVVPGGHLPRYSPDGQWLLYATANDQADPPRALKNQWFVAPARGGQARALAEDLAVTRAIWSPDSQSVLLQTRLPQRLSFNSLWRRRLDSPRPELVSDWGGQVFFLCGVTPDGKVLLGTARSVSDAEASELSRINLPALSSDSPQPIATIPSQAIGCTTDRIGRIYVQHANFTSRHHFLPLNVPANAPQPMPGPETGYSVESVSWDGRVIAYRHTLRSDSIVTGPFGVRPVSGWVQLSGDGRIAWIRRTSDIARASVVSVDDFHELKEYLTPGRIWSVTGDGQLALGVNLDNPPRPVTVLGGDHLAPFPILQHPQATLYRPKTSVDGQWVTFSSVDPHRGMRIFIAPFRQAQPVPVAEWIEAAEGTSPAFSHSGDRLFFTSNRDGNWCIYQQSLDPQTKRPLGEPAALAHLHGEYSAAELPLSSFMINASIDGLRFSLGRQQNVVSEFKRGWGRD